MSDTAGSKDVGWLRPKLDGHVVDARGSSCSDSSAPCARKRGRGPSQRPSQVRGTNLACQLDAAALQIPVMAKAHSEWTVLPHTPLTQLADNVWWLSGDLPGMSLKRTMTVVRLAQGGLLFYNAIAVDEPTRSAIEALGAPQVLVVPNGMHRLDAPAYKRRYPKLQVVGPEGSRKKIEEVLPLDRSCELFIPDPVVWFEPLAGVRSECAMWVRSSDGLTLVLNDVVFNMDKKTDFLGNVITTLLGSAPGPRVSRLGKLLLVQDRAALRLELERLAKLPELVRLVVAHEKVAHGADAQAALRRAASFL